MIHRLTAFSALALSLISLDRANAFGAPLAQQQRSSRHPTHLHLAAEKNEEVDEKAKNDALLAAIETMYGDKPAAVDEDVTKQRIQTLIQDNKVVLFMKGTKFFPQCGFSDTATKILEALEVDYEAVDVLADDAIRQGIKDFSQWPTIPQLYIKEEFIGGSDIMINMFESGEMKKIMEE